MGRFPPIPANVYRMVEKIPILLRTLESLVAALEKLSGRPDAVNKLAVYAFAAEALQRSSGVSSNEALGWLALELDEQDPDVLRWLRDLPRPSIAADALLRRTLLSLSVTFRPVAPAKRGPQDWERVITTYCRQGETAKMHRVTDRLDWSELPEDVRGACLAEGTDEIAFNLIPTPAQGR